MRQAGDGDDADVVFLTEGLDGVREFCCGLAGFDKLLHAGEAEKLALRILRFGEAVGGEGEAVSWLELEAGDGEFGVVESAEGQGAFDGNGQSVQVGRQVTGVGESDGAVGGDAQGEAGGKGFASADEFLKSNRIRITNCLIADVQMPNMSGLALYGHLAAGGSPIPTILITAYPDDAIRARALSAGVTGYLIKPFSEKDLLDCIATATKHSVLLSPVRR